MFNNKKWNMPVFPSTHPDPIPMWIADMDISVPDFIMQALKDRAEYPEFGYFFLGDRYYNSILSWLSARRGIHDLTKENILFQNNVLGAVDSALRAFTQPGDKVLVQTPGYHQFKNCILNQGRQVCGSLMKQVDGRFRMDFADMERKIVEEHIGLAILCSPHNPTGRVWEREELEQFVEICYRHQVIILSDEIHSDLVYEDNAFLPTQSISDHAKAITITLSAPSKTFNLAGLSSAYAIIYDPELKERYEKACACSHYNATNAMSIEASIAAYEHGAQWVDELRAYLKGNMELLCGLFAEKCPTIQAYVAEATYLMWLDFSATGLSQAEIKERCINTAGVVIHDGLTFIEGGDQHMRMNIACPRSVVREAGERLCAAFQSK